jgi:hypothetical protein
MRDFLITIHKQVGKRITKHEHLVSNVRNKGAAVRSMPTLRDNCVIKSIREVYHQ